MAVVENEAQLSRTHPRSKFLKAITDRQQEISGWAKEGRPNIEFARQLGQLTENVTLDLMLHEHLFELSRSRYKYKTNIRYEKKMFLQRQRMKSSALRDKLKDVQFEDRRPKWAQAQPISCEQNNTQPPPQPPPTPYKRVKLSPAPPPKPKPKPDSAPLRRNPILITEEPRAQTRTALYNTNKPRLSSAKVEKFFQTELPITRQKTPTIIETDTTLTGMIITPAKGPSPRDYTPRTGALLKLPVPPQTAPERLRPDVSYMDQSSINRPPINKKKARAAHKANVESWGLANKAVNDKRPVKDERYLRLERTLSETYFGKPNAPPVEDIVHMIETLHVAPKRRPDRRRPRVTAQFKAFLANNRGLSLNMF